MCYTVLMKQKALRDTVKCKEIECDSFYYAKGLCRRHYKMLLGKEGGYIKDYNRRKKTPGYKEMKKESDNKYRERLRGEGVLSKKQHDYYKTYILNPKNVQKKKDLAEKYYKKTKESRQEINKSFQRRYRDETKFKVLNNYSDGKLSCKNCGIDVYSVLSLDHINNNGAEHKRRLSNTNSRKVSSTVVYNDLIKNGFPPGYQVLCFNCNYHKEFMRRCE